MEMTKGGVTFDVTAAADIARLTRAGFVVARPEPAEEVKVIEETADAPEAAPRKVSKGKVTK